LKYTANKNNTKKKPTIYEEEKTIIRTIPYTTAQTNHHKFFQHIRVLGGWWLRENILKIHDNSICLFEKIARHNHDNIGD
jgi:hypothetical protein